MEQPTNEPAIKQQLDKSTMHGGMIAVQGDNNTVNQYNYQNPLEPIKPPKFIPHKGTSHFVGREQELAQIHEKLYQQQNTVAISALGGMGGVGKTELAVRYARTHQDNYCGGVCWFSARSSNIATEILTFTKNYLKLEVPQKDFQEQPLTLKQQVEWCWSNWRPPDGLVLVVFDDITDLENFADYLPASNRFRVLITTRLRNLDANIKEISLDVLSPGEALELFKKLAGEEKVNKELQTAKELCKWLGYLPLGIELVGRYIAKKPPHFILAKMLEQLKQQRLQQEAVNPKQKTLSTAQLGVLAAFEISWKELSQPTQQVALLLSLFAADIFALEWLYSMTESLNWDESEVETAIDELYQRHLVQYLESEEPDYKVHPLIREFFQMKLIASVPISELKQVFIKTFIEIAQTISYSPTLEFINSVKKAIPHLTEIAENLTDAVSDEYLPWVFTGLALFYNGQGLYRLASPWCEQCVSVVKSRSGENHSDFAASLNNLALLYFSQARYAEAEPLYLQALELIKQLLGDNHSDFAASLNNLALLYFSQARYAEAEPLYLQALELRKLLLEDNHPDIAQSLNNLAHLYFSQARYAEAEPLYLQALELIKQLLGDNHPNVATCLNNLAELYRSQARYSEAEPLYQLALELRKQLLGDNHPDIAQSLNNLALLYFSQAQYAEAEPLYLKALELRKLLLGNNHPDIAQSLNNLAELYRFQVRYAEAEPLYLQALELRKQLLGDNHPDIAQSLNNLALLYFSQARYAETKSLFQQALKLTKQLLGDKHPQVATILNNLAELYNSQGRYDEAEPLFLQALELYKQLLEDNHPDAATSLNNLAGVYYSQGRYDEAEPLLLQALELRKLLGDNHPNVATSLNNLAGVYYSQGRYDKAEPLFLQALELRKLLLGDNHPDIAQSLNNLALLYNSQGRYDEAEPLFLQALELRKLLGDNHPDVATSLNNLALLYYSQGRYDKAELIYQQCLNICEQKLGIGHPNTITVRANYAKCLKLMSQRRTS